MKKAIGLICLLMVSFSVFAQETGTYQLPPKEIMDLVLADPAPTISVDGKAKMMLLMGRSSYPEVEELGQAEMKLAGLRLNPNNFSPTRQNYIKSLKLREVRSGKEIKINGLPANLNALNPTWNPAESKIAFFNVTATGVDVHVIDVATAQAKKINTSKANLVLGNSLIWMDDATVMYKSNVNSAAALKSHSREPWKSCTKCYLSRFDQVTL
jgi:hypothetical protein